MADLEARVKELKTLLETNGSEGEFETRLSSGIVSYLTAAFGGFSLYEMMEASEGGVPVPPIFKAELDNINNDKGKVIEAIRDLYKEGVEVDSSVIDEFHARVSFVRDYIKNDHHISADIYMRDVAEALDNIASLVHYASVLGDINPDDLGSVPEKQVMYGGCKGKVLVVDDTESVAKANGRMLDGAGYIVSYAKGKEAGPEAIEMLKSGNFDVVVTDIDMPIKRGTEVIKAANEAGIKAVAVSGQPDSIDDALNAGAHAGLSKPYGIELIRGAVYFSCEAGKE